MKSRSVARSWVLLALFTAAIAHAQEQPAAAPKAEPAKEAAAAPQEPPDPAHVTWYAQALAQGPGGLNVTQFWSKGNMLRAETAIAGHKIVTIVNGDWYYAYDATKGIGIQVRRTPEAIANARPYVRPFGNEALKLIKQGAEKVREENFHGRETDVYQLTDRLGRRMIWVSKDALNIPFRVEVYNRSLGTKQSTDYIDWLTGLALPDEYFNVDPNVEITAYEFEEYVHFTGKVGNVGPVPVLYLDLLRGR